MNKYPALLIIGECGESIPCVAYGPDYAEAVLSAEFQAEALCALGVVVVDLPWVAPSAG